MWISALRKKIKATKQKLISKKNSPAPGISRHTRLRVGFNASFDELLCVDSSISASYLPLLLSFLPTAPCENK